MEGEALCHVETFECGCHRYVVRDEEELRFLRTQFARVQAAEGLKK